MTFHEWQKLHSVAGELAHVSWPDCAEIYGEEFRAEADALNVAGLWATVPQHMKDMTPEAHIMMFRLAGLIE